MAACSFLLAMLPFSSMLCLATFGASCVAFAAIPRPRHGSDTLFPQDIHDPALRNTYARILTARSDLEYVLVGAPGFAASARSLGERCDEAVRICARVVPVANRVHAYLSVNDAWRVAHEAALLRSSSAVTQDEVAARNFAQAADAYDRQLALCDELARTRDRIQARLDLVLASLRSFAAAVVRQQVAEDEQLAVAGESIAENVEGVRRELEVLESALELDAAA
jgi:hypothetical protein